MMWPSADAIYIIMQRELMPSIVSYDTLNSTPSSMDDPYAHVLEYRSYWLSISVFYNLKYMLGLSIFVFGGNEERKNSALNVVDVAIFS